MTEKELREIMAYLEARVELASPGSRVIAFRAPAAEEMVTAGLNARGVAQLLEAPWWPEMMGDVVETPDYCDPEEAPETVLRYARDVVREYIRKRFVL